ncbi:MAG TPA: hypothetical protein EYQ51_08035 [Alphaproteobacteria bacterium]|nr:hypothetical protein [Alphaproteobacteria bacterium]
MNKYITVLDFEVSRIFQYKLEEFGDDYMFVDRNTPTNEELEDILVDQGHSLGNIEWMAHDIAGIINNNDGSYGKL